MFFMLRGSFESSPYVHTISREQLALRDDLLRGRWAGPRERRRRRAGIIEILHHNGIPAPGSHADAAAIFSGCARGPIIDKLNPVNPQSRPVIGAGVECVGLTEL